MGKKKKGRGRGNPSSSGEPGEECSTSGRCDQGFYVGDLYRTNDDRLEPRNESSPPVNIITFIPSASGRDVSGQDSTSHRYLRVKFRKLSVRRDDELEPRNEEAPEENKTPAILAEVETERQDSSSTSRMNARRLAVGSFVQEAKYADLEREFSRYGPVNDIKMMTSYNRFCVVEFKDAASAAACKTGIMGNIFEGKPWVIELPWRVVGSGNNRETEFSLTIGERENQRRRGIEIGQSSGSSSMGGTGIEPYNPDFPQIPGDAYSPATGSAGSIQGLNTGLAVALYLMSRGYQLPPRYHRMAAPYNNMGESASSSYPTQGAASVRPNIERVRNEREAAGSGRAIEDVRDEGKQKVVVTAKREKGKGHERDKRERKEG